MPAINASFDRNSIVKWVEIKILEKIIRSSYGIDTVLFAPTYANVCYCNICAIRKLQNVIVNGSHTRRLPSIDNKIVFLYVGLVVVVGHGLGDRDANNNVGGGNRGRINSNSNSVTL